MVVISYAIIQPSWMEQVKEASNDNYFEKGLLMKDTCFISNLLIESVIA